MCQEALVARANSRFVSLPNVCADAHGAASRPRPARNNIGRIDLISSCEEQQRCQVRRL
jgi:hypothetical protein